MALNVNIDDLVASGVAVTGHGEEVATKHCAADSRMERARGGWQGQSAASMSLRMTAWSATTTALLTRLSDHAQGLHTCAQQFWSMEERHADALKVPGQQADTIAAGM